VSELRTVALEFVPPNVEDGAQRAIEDAEKVLEHSRDHGLDGRIGHVMIPGIIAEEDDRPVEMKPKIDTLEVWTTISPLLSPVRGLCTQVTAFMDEDALTERLQTLTGAGIEGVIFVGVPRTMADGEGPGVAPTDALALFGDVVAHRGVILIPTREGEHGRFDFKCRQGATFGMTQLLYSDAIVGFLQEFARLTDHRPEILLSFGFVPNVEQRIGLIDWLIQDAGNQAVAAEQAFVADLAASSSTDRRRKLLDLYARVIDGVADLGFPLSVHLEAPYGFSGPAFEAFAELLGHWSPD
jgi:hypothetical protein